MSEPFLGQISIVGFNFAPQGWAQCDGQLLPISQYTALFALLGTFYGGNGQTNFALPNLQGAAAMDFGSGAGLTPRDLGETGGEATVTITNSELGSHTHPLAGETAVGSVTSGVGAACLGAAPGTSRKAGLLYKSGALTTPVTLNQSVIPVGGGSGQPHNNLQPYLVMNFIIALNGIFPSRN